MLLDNLFEFIKPSKSEQLIMYIIQHTDGDTQIFSRTYSRIQKDLGISKNTISRVMNTLQESGTIDYLGGSKWRIKAVTGYSDTCDGPGFYVTNKGT